MGGRIESRAHTPLLTSPADPRPPVDMPRAVSGDTYTRTPRRSGKLDDWTNPLPFGLTSRPCQWGPAAWKRPKYLTATTGGLAYFPQRADAEWATAWVARCMGAVLLYMALRPGGVLAAKSTRVLDVRRSVGPSSSIRATGMAVLANTHDQRNEAAGRLARSDQVE